MITLSSKSLVKDAFLNVEGGTIKLSDNYFVLLPNISKSITVGKTDVEISTIEVRSLIDKY